MQKELFSPPFTIQLQRVVYIHISFYPLWFAEVFLNTRIELVFGYILNYVLRLHIEPLVANEGHDLILQHDNDAR